MVADVLLRIPVFLLVVFRLAGMMLMSPIFSSPRVPKRVKALLTIVLAFGVSGGVRAVPLPDSTWDLAVGIGGEMAFGAAMGMLVSFTFVAAQWAGEMIGIEMGLNMSEVFDPAMGGGGSIVGDLYYFLTLAVFLTVGGHHFLIDAVHASFDKLPPLSLAVDQPLLDLLVAMTQSAMAMAVRLAAPVLVTVMVTDLALGLVGRAIPQFNVMQAGLSVRALVGLAIVIAGLGLTGSILGTSVGDSLNELRRMWTTERPGLTGN